MTAFHDSICLLQFFLINLLNYWHHAEAKKKLNNAKILPRKQKRRQHQRITKQDGDQREVVGFFVCDFQIRPSAITLIYLKVAAEKNNIVKNNKIQKQQNVKTKIAKNKTS